MQEITLWGQSFSRSKRETLTVISLNQQLKQISIFRKTFIIKETFNKVENGVYRPLQLPYVVNEIMEIRRRFMEKKSKTKPCNQDKKVIKRNAELLQSIQKINRICLILHGSVIMSYHLKWCNLVSNLDRNRLQTCKD